MNRKISWGGAITLAIMFSTVTFIMTMIFAQKAFNSRVFHLKERESMYVKLAEVDRLIRQNYLNPIDEENLSDHLVEGYLLGVEDPYGNYLTPEQYKEQQNSFSGRLADVGVLCAADPSGYLRIEEVYADSPAAAAELERGDLIVKIDDLAVTADNYHAAVDALRGEAGTAVSLQLHRDKEEIKAEVTRRKVDIPTVEGDIVGNVGYILIKEFTENTPQQFAKVMHNLILDGAKGLAFDVRANAVGEIDAVSRILNTLLPKGTILSAVYRNDPEPKVLSESDAEEIALPMAVLINGKTSYAAELFAQSLKDYNKAKAIGTTSAGRATMQETLKLSDGSAITYTVAELRTAVSPNLEGVGVKPDYELKTQMETDRKTMIIDLMNDPQLRKALEVVEAQIKGLPVEEQPAESSSSPNGIQELTPEEAEALKAELEQGEEDE